MEDLENMRIYTKSIRSTFFHLISASFLSYLLYEHYGLYALIYLGLLAFVETIRIGFVRLIRWAYKDDIAVLDNYPTMGRNDGFRSVVCPKCHGIRAYNGVIRAREHDLDSCTCTE